MKEQKKTIEKYSLLLAYNQNMYLISVFEIILYFSRIYNKKYGLDLFDPEKIDEYDRHIVTSSNLKLLTAFQQELKEYGVNTMINNLEDPEFRSHRLKYIKYKFPDYDPYDFETSLRENYQRKHKIVFHYEPIILEVNKQSKYYGNKLLFILYKQSVPWANIEQILAKLAKKYSHIGLSWHPLKINRYNRIFYYDTNEENIRLIRQELTKKEINTLVLDQEEEFITYRLEYIQHYYPDMGSSFLHAKWRLEYENGWFNRERWDPIIFIPKKTAKVKPKNKKLKK